MSSQESTIRAAVIPSALATVRARAPKGLEVLELDEDLDLDTVDFLVPKSGDPRVLKSLPDLRRLAVIQVVSAGTDWIEDRVPPQATLCSGRGARDAPVAQWVLAALLSAASGLLESARDRSWREDTLTDLERLTVLVVGMGSIGRMVQSRLRPFGAGVIGVASHARDGVHGIEDLLTLLPRADAVVLLVPLSESTRGLIGAEELAAMREGALLVNAARGPVIDTDALLAEVSSGRLRAVLDVTDPEPLPDGHPLWSAPGVLCITPHLAGDSAAGHERAAELAGAQLARWCAGDELQNVVRRGTR